MFGILGLTGGGRCQPALLAAPESCGAGVNALLAVRRLARARARRAALGHGGVQARGGRVGVQVSAAAQQVAPGKHVGAGGGHAQQQAVHVLGGAADGRLQGREDEELEFYEVANLARNP